MTWILEGVKVGDPVIVVSSNIGPDGLRRTVRHIERVTKVFKHVLQTERMTGVGIATGRASWPSAAMVTPATEADIAEVLRETEERRRADAERKAKQEADAAERRRRDELTGDIRKVLYRHVPEDVLIRALRVLRGEV